MSLHQTLPRGRTSDNTPGVAIEQHEPIAPANGACYSVAKIKVFSNNKRAWYKANRHLSICQEDYIDTDDSVSTSHDDDVDIAQLLTSLSLKMNVDQANGPAAKPSLAPTPIYPPLVRCYKDDVGKILKGWPTKNLPEFSGDPSSNAKDWLGRMKTWLSYVQAHPRVWHSVAGCCLTGTVWNHWQDAAVNNARPDNWDGFRTWFLAHSPLGPTTHSVHTALQKLHQRSDKSTKDFPSLAILRSLPQLSLQEEVKFMAKLRSGLSHKVPEAYHTAERDSRKLNLLQLFTTAINCDQAYHSRPVASGSSSRGRSRNHSGKRRAEGNANEASGKIAPVLCYNCKSTTHCMNECPIPKTAHQLAYEAVHPFPKNA
ncbi:hypothetical protein MJO29_004261 [Puccinia striiformis f. sp. tritici]|uniref:Uncharacterized protein n=1 Tax=Puccinia striiformis TaxID=27350 RepID=A0A2S4VR62_9BASI|nr:hypothetical protein MJO29_004261 [Puccinia striiformis f. sp. tritici]POW12027.1 hypothetical protein PSTT_04777 [Puccinia striiformis]